MMQKIEPQPIEIDGDDYDACQVDWDDMMEELIGRWGVEVVSAVANSRIDWQEEH